MKGGWRKEERWKGGREGERNELTFPNACTGRGVLYRTIQRHIYLIAHHSDTCTGVCDRLVRSDNSSPKEPSLDGVHT